MVVFQAIEALRGLWKPVEITQHTGSQKSALNMSGSRVLAPSYDIKQWSLKSGFPRVWLVRRPAVRRAAGRSGLSLTHPLPGVLPITMAVLFGHQSLRRESSLRKCILTPLNISLEIGWSVGIVPETEQGKELVEQAGCMLQHGAFDHRSPLSVGGQLKKYQKESECRSRHHDEVDVMV